MKHNRDNKGRFILGNTIQLGMKHSDETRSKMKKSQKESSYWKGKVGPNKGRKFSEKLKRIWSLAKTGKKHWNWKGGFTPELARLRNGRQIRAWRQKVYLRDGYTCVVCGNKDRICADHIKSFRDYPEFRFDVKNGRTLCYPCHYKTESFGGRKIRPEQVVKLQVDLIN